MTDDEGQERVKGYWSKMAKEWRCCVIYSNKTTDFQDALKAEILQAASKANSQEEAGMFDHLNAINIYRQYLTLTLVQHTNKQRSVSVLVPNQVADNDEYSKKLPKIKLLVSL